MRSKEDTRKAALAFGALATELALKAGYDLAPYRDGRVRLAADSGMSRSAVDRMLKGETLPDPDTYEELAQALAVDVDLLFVTAGVLKASSRRTRANRALVSSDELTPEDAADHWNITDPTIRSMLLMNIRHAMELQSAATGGREGSASGG